MAEGLAKSMLGQGHNIQSAGSIPSGEIHPNAVIAMDEVGIDIRDQFSKSTNDLDKDFIDNLDFAITLCAEEVCPVFLSEAPRLHWPLTDPDRKHQDLTDDQRLEYFRVARDDIRARIEELAAQRR